MKERVKAFVVVLDGDLREEVAEPILTALSMVRGVISVEPVHADMIDDHIARTRVRRELWAQIEDVFFPPEKAEKT